MNKKILHDTLKKNRYLMVFFVVSTAVNLSVFLLYRMQIEAFLYASLLLLFFCLGLLLADFLRCRKKLLALTAAEKSVENGDRELPPAETESEAIYAEMIAGLFRRIDQISLDLTAEKQDTEDWYTLWVHEIKTPLAVLKLRIPESEKEIRNELFRIEEYADMALSYIRLGSEKNDLVIRPYTFDELIREPLRKYAPQFIAKKIRLDYTPSADTVITDKKWFQCILEQLISNAVKYTEGGTVTVTAEERCVTVKDTGIGISRADLPRIFEKGYTGINGRTGAKSSGLGLYLTKRAAGIIGVSVIAESMPGEGSSFSVRFPERRD